MTVVPESDPVTPSEVKSCGLLRAEDLVGVAEKMWAYLTIRQMLQRRLGEDNLLKKQQMKDRAIELAMKVRIST